MRETCAQLRRLAARKRLCRPRLPRQAATAPTPPSHHPRPNLCQHPSRAPRPQLRAPRFVGELPSRLRRHQSASQPASVRSLTAVVVRVAEASPASPATRPAAAAAAAAAQPASSPRGRELAGGENKACRRRRRLPPRRCPTASGGRSRRRARRALLRLQPPHRRRMTFLRRGQQLRPCPEPTSRLQRTPPRVVLGSSAAPCARARATHSSSGVVCFGAGGQLVRARRTKSCVARLG